MTPADGGAAGDWIEWSGGECPVDPYQRVDVKWSDGIVENGFRAREHEWVRRLTISKARLVAYRVVQP